jgi:serine phosphatase RsbU (regulator of sigma subunit)
MMGWKIDIASAATHKYAVSKSGDVVDIVERPGGGYGIVLVDGQGSGPAGRAIARLVACQATRLLQDGARAEVAATAASDALLHARSGQVSAGLDVVTIDPGLGVEIARFSSNLIVVRHDCSWSTLQRAGEPAGRLQDQTPEIESIPLVDGLTIVLATDGIAQAGSRFGISFDLLAELQSTSVEQDATVLCRRVLESATTADRGRPQDDLSVVAILVAGAESDQRVQRQYVSDVWR